MKALFFTTIILSAVVSFAEITISGVLIKDAGTYYLSSESDCGRYKIRSPHNEVWANLHKLSHHDALTAAGTINTITCEVDIQSIEYVGLRRLLGKWHTEAGLITVNDYKSLSIYPNEAPQKAKLSLHDGGIEPITFRYSILPSPGKQWVVFLSNTDTTTFATLSFYRTTATLKTFDSETGKVLQELRMSRRKK